MRFCLWLEKNSVATPCGGEAAFAISCSNNTDDNGRERKRWFSVRTDPSQVAYYVEKNLLKNIT